MLAWRDHLPELTCGGCLGPMLPASWPVHNADTCTVRCVCGAIGGYIRMPGTEAPPCPLLRPVMVA